MRKITLFLSCVSDEFHKEDPSIDPSFRSWRTTLERTLNALERAHVIVITQETALESAQGDLLEILEDAVRRSDHVIHLYGKYPGVSPPKHSLQRLSERHPDFLGNHPEIRDALPDWPLISYTQWELYFAFLQGGETPLIYLAEEHARRSPAVSDPASRIRITLRCWSSPTCSKRGNLSLPASCARPRMR